MKIKPLEPSKWTDAHREVLGPSGGPTQVQVCLHNLELCRKYWTFTTQLTTNYTLPLRDKELYNSVGLALEPGIQGLPE